MKPTRGENLTPKQIAQVKAAFLYRWTIENKDSEAWAYISTPRIPLVTDEEWIKEHAFYFRKDGQLSRKHTSCVPVYMAD